MGLSVVSKEVSHSRPWDPTLYGSFRLNIAPINLEGPPLKSLLCEMGGATVAGQPRGTTPEVFTL